MIKTFLNVMRASARTYLYICVVFFMALPAQAQNQPFFETLYDVPVMQGLEEVPEMAISFDKPNGRIAEAGAVADNLSTPAILSFYKESLSQLGWTLSQGTKNETIYTREDEKLSISIDKLEVSLVVRFTLEPKES